MPETSDGAMVRLVFCRYGKAAARLCLCITLNFKSPQENSTSQSRELDHVSIEKSTVLEQPGCRHKQAKSIGEGTKRRGQGGTTVPTSGRSRKHRDAQKGKSFPAAVHSLTPLSKLQVGKSQQYSTGLHI